MRRRSFNAVAAVSLALCLATVVLWLAAQRGRISTGRDGLRSAYFDKSYEVEAGERLIVVRWEETIDQAAGERKAFSTDYSGPGDGTFVFRRAPNGTGPFGRPWARQGVLAFPYWAVILATAVAPAFWAARFLARQRRSRRAGVCVTCGYDLRATPDRCPECGAVPGAIGTAA